MNIPNNVVLFDRYQTIEKLYDGSIFTSYLGTDLRTNRRVVISIINPDHYTSYEVDKICFTNEISAIKSFDHKNILKTYSADNYTNTICIVNEYFESVSLDTYLKRRGIIDVHVALSILSQLASALRYAGNHGILHRGIKSKNICISDKDAEPVVKLANFGLTYIIDYHGKLTENIPEDFGYLAPEATGILNRKVDTRADLYSLGVILYRCLSGQLPFSANSIDNLVYQHVAVQPRPIEELNPSVPAEISTMLAKLLAKDPDLRYQTPNELINDIDRYLCSSLISMRSPQEDIIHSLNAKCRLLSRKQELAKLIELTVDSTTKNGNFCFVHGPYESGKTDLFNNYTQELSGMEIPFIRAGFKPQAKLTPYYGFSVILDQFIETFEQYDHKSQVAERNRLARTLSGLSNLVTKINPAMSKILPCSLSLPTLEGYKEQQRAIMLLSDFFLSLYQQDKPYVLILDDLQNADAASLILLGEMASKLQDVKVFIVCSYRELDEDKHLHLKNLLSSVCELPCYREIVLQPFSETRMCEFLSDLLGIRRMDCQMLASYLIEKTDGNPYFTANVLRSMLEDGIISVYDRIIEQNWDRLRAVNSDNDLVPFILKRMDSLGEEAVSVFEIAAVMGFEFSVTLLMHISDVAPETISPWIEKAISLQFIDYSSTGDILTFAHQDIHAAFLSRINPERLKQLHLLIARGIETLTNTTKNIYSLVYHLIEAGDTDILRKYILIAADEARNTGANEEAITYYQKAVEIFVDGDSLQNESWVKAKRALVELNLISGHFEETINIASTLLPFISNRLERAKLFHFIGQAHFRSGNYDDAESALASALEVLGRPLPSSRFTLNARLSVMKANRTLAKHHNLTTLVVSKLQKDSEEHIITAGIYSTLCVLYKYSNLTKYEYAVLNAYSFSYMHLGISSEFADSLCSLSMYQLYKGDIKAADDSLTYAMIIFNSLNDAVGIAKCHLYSGILQQSIGDVAKSIRNLKEACEKYKAIGDPWEASNASAYLAISYQLNGEYTNALSLCENNIATSRRLKDGLCLSMSYGILVICYTEMGNLPSAEEIAVRGLNICENFQFPYITCMMKLSQGRLFYEQGRYSEAVAALEKSRSYFEQRSFVNIGVLSLYSHLAIARVALVSSIKNTMELAELQRHVAEISELCDKALKLSKNSPLLQACAYRANCRFNSLIENDKRIDFFSKRALSLTDTLQYRYENAKIHFENGVYLLNLHKTNEARFYIFEAYMTFSAISSSYYLKKCEAIISAKYQEDFANNTMLANVSARQNRLNTERKVNTLLKLGERLTSTLELEELQRKILQDAVELVGAERGILFLYPESGEQKLYVASVFNLGHFDCNTYDWMLQEVEKSQKPIVINDVQSDEYRKHYTVMVRYGIKSVMAMPMFVRGKMFGVIYLDSRLVRQIFSDDYIETMGFIANQAGAPIANARLYHRAISDGLTGIFGRSYLDNLIIDRTSLPGSRLAAIMIDVDDFKHCNDTYGHPFGDKVLRQIANVMKRICGDSGIPCRYGGEEFVIILDNNDAAITLDIAERIRQTVENSTIAFNTGKEVILVNVTVSIGCSLWEYGMERVELIEHADKALYYAKHTGKNKIQLWSEEIDNVHEEDLI